MLLGHPVAGASWEGFVIETLINSAPRHTEAYFYRTSAGAEVDLVLKLPGNSLWAIKIKRSLTPKVEKGFYFACDDLKPDVQYVVYPGKDRSPVTNALNAISLADLALELMEYK